MTIKRKVIQMRMQYNPETQELELDADEVARVAALKALYAIEDEEAAQIQAERDQWMARVQRLDNGQIFQPPKNDRVYQSAGYASQIEGQPHASKWDWWQATVSVESWGSVTSDGEYVDGVDNLLSWLAEKMPFADVRTKPGGTGYKWLTSYVQGDNTVCQVLHGGSNPDPNIKASGYDSEQVRAWIVEAFPEGRISRMDSAVDSMAGTGEFEKAAAWLEERATQAGINCRWIKNSDPTKGNTLYVGSQNSRVMIRLYEKGKQMGYKPNEWWRAEVQLRPDSKNKDAAYYYKSSMCWAATRVTREFYEMITGNKLEAVGFQQPSKQKTLDVRAAHLVKQYGRLLKELAEEEGGWLHVGAYLEKIAEETGVGRLTQPEAGERG